MCCGLVPRLAEMWVVEQMRCLSSNHQPIASLFVESCLISLCLFCDRSKPLFLQDEYTGQSLTTEIEKLHMIPYTMFLGDEPICQLGNIVWQCPLWILHPMVFTQREHFSTHTAGWVNKGDWHRLQCENENASQLQCSMASNHKPYSLWPVQLFCDGDISLWCVILTIEHSMLSDGSLIQGKQLSIAGIGAIERRSWLEMNQGSCNYMLLELGNNSVVIWSVISYS